MACRLLTRCAMIQPKPPARRATAEDLRAAFGEDARVEVIHGELVQKAAPAAEHSSAQGSLLTVLSRRFHRAPGDIWPGGWWLLPEIHARYDAHEVFCHDVAGWRRDRLAERPSGWPIDTRPDWVLEVLSPGHKRRDRFDKWRVLHQARVPHYWLADHESKSLEVYRWHPDGYLNVLLAGTGELVRAEPFDAVELGVDVLLGDADDIP